MQRLKQLCFSILLIPTLAFAIDMENGEEINEVCAGCHGEYGQGGKKGEYPRLAGMPSAFIAKQLHLFRDRLRPNLAMVEYVDDRQMPDEDIQDIAHYLEQIVLKTKLPPADETSPDFNAYQRLLESKRLMQIPLAPGDIKSGKKRYKKECASCHGREGLGDIKKAVPMLAGQYTNYLWRQVKKYRENIRIHDEDEPDDELLLEFSDQELTDIFAYLSTVDD
ncbi:MAG: c-type cytochrome [Candidatus Thiodiazotropha sp. (ex Lucinoma annulata)]|nr:c-type cytochrome [Candidatus Thiodiazotropha sp. (ex Lucinoma borealis)]MCU7837901.1 c-type cytochrome [Candidatus Thiodiazotropha sp. (ex Troendleina suluensis)]MCU7885575.1 c-type cytochrome [Candidatus Thiodiazotropha sp. (ex Lucinoma annulata)]MCU7862967.1 c-type cytochrome [Candidatus Thiodiazotropha sp. (ex Lucinoma borealis)]MCU7869694.1 c-type cytochrome [Candidatus Thiodiazotropha sp. (ex Lucinoma borealis)]